MLSLPISLYPWIRRHELTSFKTTAFPGSSLFLPRESTLVAAGHVSVRVLQIPEKLLRGGAGRIKFVSTKSRAYPLCRFDLNTWTRGLFQVEFLNAMTALFFSVLIIAQRVSFKACTP